MQSITNAPNRDSFVEGFIIMLVVIELPVISEGLEIGTIDLETMEMEIGSPIHFTCTSRVDCCTTMRIPASTYDIERIMAKGWELDQIVRDLSPVLLNTNSPQGPSEKAYILKRKPYDGSCTFLEEDLCRIHEYKPFACKLYPFALDFVSETTIRIVIHQQQLCESIRAVPVAEANNISILSYLRDVIVKELEKRGHHKPEHNAFSK